MGNGRLTEIAQNIQGCEKCNLRKAVGNLELPYGCEITVVINNPTQNNMLVNLTYPIYGIGC